MTHTPGPWSADYGDFAAYCETGAEVCEVTRGSHDDGSRIPDDEMEANLNLVAAAPAPCWRRCVWACSGPRMTATPTITSW